MALLPPNLNLTDKDFDSLRLRLIALVKSVFPDWSDFSTASFGNVLLELYAFVGDVLTYYLDQQARESRLVTATQRKNVLALCRMLGYKLHGAGAATANLSFTLARPALADVLVPAGTIIRTREVTEPVRFQLLSDLILPAGTREGTGVVEHSATHVQLYDSRGLSDLELILDQVPFLDGSARVSAGNGDYCEQDSFLGSGPNDRHFLVLVDQNDRATMRFGNGTSGAPPTGTVTVIYKTGGGCGGNVDAGRLVVLEGTFSDAHGRPVQLTVRNPEPASGGTDRQSVASAKLLAPESLRTLTRSVTREDFEINARRVPGVARALMLSANEDPTIAENSGILLVIPQGGGMPTPALKNLVLDQVTRIYPAPLTFQLSVQNPVYKTINIEAHIFLSQGQAAAAVRERIKTNLATMFRVSEPDGTPNPLVDFGFNLKDSWGNPAGEVAWSDVFNVIRDTQGVRKVLNAPDGLKLSGLSADVKLGLKEFPALGTITLLNGETGSSL